MSDPTQTYFTRTYPGRTVLSGLLFRHGEVARMSMVRSWLGSTDRVDILDAGCGDGRFLQSVLSGPPKKVRLEDVVPLNIQTAYSNISGLAETVEAVACDSFKCDGSRYEVVLAIGILDYQQDWKQALSLLVRRTRGVLITDLPRADHPRNLLRYLWFRCRGIQVALVGRQELAEALHSLGLAFELDKTQLEWFVRIKM